MDEQETFLYKDAAAKKSRFFLATKQFDPVRIIRAVGSGQWAVVDVDVVIVLSPGYSICSTRVNLRFTQDGEV